MTNSAADQEIELSLSDIFSVFRKRFWLIVLCAIYLMAGSFLLSYYVIDEKYTATVSMYVAPNDNDSDRIASLSDLNYAQAVVDTYIEILKTNTFMETVAQESGLGYSAREIKDMVSMSAVNGTEIFEVQVTTEEPNHSFTLANIIAEQAPVKIIEIKDADAVRVVDPAILPEAPSSPNVLRNTAVGLLLGLALGVGIAFVLEILDVRIKGKDDLFQIYGIPVLGQVPLVTD